MSVINRVIGGVQKAHEEVRQAKKEVVTKFIDEYVTSPISLVFHAALYGVCFGIIVFGTVTGLMLALKW